MRVRIEFVPRDCWVGVFWKAGHCWVCLVPFFPIHFTRGQ